MQTMQPLLPLPWQRMTNQGQNMTLAMEEKEARVELKNRVETAPFSGFVSH
jgi:hypothetical protein